ncbi:heparinase II/III family protein [Salibacterium aidingense]|uniref:heparinase II/III family protein n=1 Tax=Salibacterium aidingense TaxID=384933 RepID=UPI00040F23D5|nr:heparinase II/III family protein [Salibacterium aidingense]
MTMTIPALTQRSGLQLLPDKTGQKEWWETRNKDPAYKKLVEELYAEAGVEIQRPAPHLTFTHFKEYFETGDRKGYENLYFKRRKRLNIFTLMVLLHTGDSKYLEALHNEIWDICNEYTWCLPAHVHLDDKAPIDLFAAETAFALGEIRSLAQAWLDPWLADVINREIHRRVLEPFRCYTYEWETARHNWAAVCAGSIGAAALHIVEAEEVLREILERNLRSMNCFLEGFEADGGCKEGYQYWQYGFGFFVYFADMMKTKSEGTVDLFQEEKVYHIALFQQKCFLYQNNTANFSDCPAQSSVLIGLSHYLHHIYPDVEVPSAAYRFPFPSDHCARWAPLLREWIWMDEELESKDWSDAVYYLPQSQWLTARHTAGADHFVFAAKGGHNDEPHNHNDVGHFILGRNEQFMLKDLGAGLYQKGYFGRERYQFITNSSRGHSLPCIDGVYQSAGINKKAEVTHYHTEKDIVTFGLDLKHTYMLPQLQTLHRMFIWKQTASPALTVRDSYCFTKKPGTVVERFIMSDMDMEIQEGSIISSGLSLTIFFDSRQLEATLKRCSFINHSNTTQWMNVLDLHVLKPGKEFTVDVHFLPHG